MRVVPYSYKRPKQKMQTKRNKEFCLMKKKLKFTKKHEKTTGVIAVMFAVVFIIAWNVVDHSRTSIKANAPGEESITTTITTDISTTKMTTTSTSVTTTTCVESTTITKTTTTESETTTITTTTVCDTTTIATTSLVTEKRRSRGDEYLVALAFDEEDDSFSEEYVEEETNVTETYIEEEFFEETTTTEEYYEEEYYEEETDEEEYYDEEDEYEYTQLPITEDERILLCNLVGREYGQDYIPTYEKAKVVAVVMNRVRAGSDAGFADTIYGVLTQPYQFSGYYVSYEYTWQVTDDVIAAVDYYFTYPEEFSSDIYYFYGDGYYNYFY